MLGEKGFGSVRKMGFVPCFEGKGEGLNVSLSHSIVV